MSPKNSFSACLIPCPTWNNGRLDFANSRAISDSTFTDTACFDYQSIYSITTCIFFHLLCCSLTMLHCWKINMSNERRTRCPQPKCNNNKSRHLLSSNTCVLYVSGHIYPHRTHTGGQSLLHRFLSHLHRFSGVPYHHG